MRANQLRSSETENDQPTRSTQHQYKKKVSEIAVATLILNEMPELLARGSRLGEGWEFQHRDDSYSVVFGEPVCSPGRRWFRMQPSQLPTCPAPAARN